MPLKIYLSQPDALVFNSVAPLSALQITGKPIDNMPAAVGFDFGYNTWNKEGTTYQEDKALWTPYHNVRIDFGTGSEDGKRLLSLINGEIYVQKIAYENAHFEYTTNLVPQKQYTATKTRVPAYTFSSQLFDTLNLRENEYLTSLTFVADMLHVTNPSGWSIETNAATGEKEILWGDESMGQGYTYLHNIVFSFRNFRNFPLDGVSIMDKSEGGYQFHATMIADEIKGEKHT